MNKTQTKTDKKQTKESICSTISRKLFLNSRKDSQEENGDSSSIPGQGNAKSDEKNRRDNKKGNNNQKYEMKTILKKLMRTTPFMSKALQSPYAYENGKKNCETCTLDKDSYKSMMKSVKVVELVVNDVINKAQKEMMDDGDGHEKEKHNGKSETKGGTRISFQFEVYCQKNIDHNLKCVLVKLQKTIGDVLLQVSYCKMKNNPNDVRCKKYKDVSVNILEHLKFEYINLTNHVIQLFGAPAKQNGSPDICVACIKEEITDCTEMLEKMLSSGRNLKVTMRNDGKKEEKCCSRTYPHVHALVQDKHVVLKFEMPFMISPGKADEDPTKTPQGDNLKETQSNKSDLSKPSGNSLKSTNSGKERPSASNSLKSTSNASVKDSAQGPNQPKSTTSADGESKKFCGCNFDEAEQKLKEEENKNETTNLQQPKEQNKVEENNFKTPKEQNNVEKNNLEQPKEQNKVEEKNLEQPKEQNKVEENNLEQPKMAGLDLKPSSPIVDDKDDNLKGSSKTGQAKKEEISSQKSESEDRDSDYSGDSFFSLEDESVDSLATVKKQKQVAFSSSSSKPKVFHMGGTSHSIFKVGETPSQNILKKQFDHHEPVSPICPKRSFNNEKPRKSVISAIDSVVLVKNKHTSLQNYSQSPENTSLGALQSDSGTEKPLVIQAGTVNLEMKSSKLLNKQQISEVLKDLGAAKLMSVSMPAECCKNNQFVEDFQCISDLPYSASLHSLPLDQNDLDHITQAVEKLMSTEDTVHIPDEGIEGNSEMQYQNALVKEKENKSEWYNAFTARDSASNISIDVQTNMPVMTKRVSRNQIPKDITNLPTIKEEDEEKSRKSTMSADKDGNKIVLSSNKSTTPTELRFFTVEYSSDLLNKLKLSNGENESCHTGYKYVGGFLELEPEISSIEKMKDFEKEHNNDGFLNLSNRTQLISKTQDKNHSKEGNKKTILSPVDEMIMLDAIYLTSKKNCNTSTNTSSLNLTKPISTQNPSNYCQEYKRIKNEKCTFTSSSLAMNNVNSEVGKVITSQNKGNSTKNICGYSNFFVNDSSSDLNIKDEDEIVKTSIDSGDIGNTATITHLKKEKNENEKKEVKNVQLSIEVPNNNCYCEAIDSNQSTFNVGNYFRCFENKDFVEFKNELKPIICSDLEKTDVLTCSHSIMENNISQCPLRDSSHPNKINNSLVTGMNRKRQVLNLRSYAFLKKTLVRASNPTRSKTFIREEKISVFKPFKSQKESLGKPSRSIANITDNDTFLPLHNQNNSVIDTSFGRSVGGRDLSQIESYLLRSKWKQ